MKSEKIIYINFRRLDFESMYFRNHQANYIKSPFTKKAFRYILLFGIAFIINVSLASNYKEFDTPALLTGMFFMLSVFNYTVQANKLRKWKNNVEEFISMNEKFKSHFIKLTDKTFSLVQDDTEIIEDWSNFKKVNIETDLITLNSNRNYLIPQFSMKKEEFEFLKKVLSDKVTDPSNGD